MAKTTSRSRTVERSKPTTDDRDDRVGREDREERRSRVQRQSREMRKRSVCPFPFVRCQFWVEGEEQSTLAITSTTTRTRVINTNIEASSSSKKIKKLDVSTQETRCKTKETVSSKKNKVGARGTRLCAVPCRADPAMQESKQCSTAGSEGKVQRMEGQAGFLNTGARDTHDKERG
jgi:hypothetical protein